MYTPMAKRKRITRVGFLSNVGEVIVIDSMSYHSTINEHKTTAMVAAKVLKIVQNLLSKSSPCIRHSIHHHRHDQQSLEESCNIKLGLVH